MRVGNEERATLRDVIGEALALRGGEFDLAGDDDGGVRVDRRPAFDLRVGSNDVKHVAEDAGQVDLVRAGDWLFGLRAYWVVRSPKVLLQHPFVIAEAEAIRLLVEVFE